MQEYFNVIRLAREDVSQILKKDCSKLTDETMALIAGKLSNALFENGYWDILHEVLLYALSEQLADGKLPKLKQEDI